MRDRTLQQPVGQISEKFPRRWAAVVLAGGVLAGCAASGPAGSRFAALPLSGPANAPAAASPVGEPPVGTDIPAALFESGVRLLEEGRAEAAVRPLQAAIQLRPDAMPYHLALGTAQLARYRLGADTAEAAQTAFEVAARLDPRSAFPHVQLGNLAWEQRRWPSAQAAYARAYARDTRRVEVLEGLMASSWYAGDFTSANWAVREARERSLETPLIGRAAVLLAAVGEGDSAEREWGDYVQRYRVPPQDADLLRQRARELREVRLVLAAAGKSDAAAEAAKEKPADDAAPPTVARWFDCDKEPGFFKPPEASGKAEGASSTTAGGDETERLPAIPAPCPGAPAPRSVILDTAIIRAQDVASSSYGVNLLGALSVYATGVRTLSSGLVSTEEGTAPGSGRTFSLNLGATPALNYISYALDIANSVATRGELLSRPTLIALDRLPSTFFSGAVITLGVTGTSNSSSTISDKPVGVSLSITPTVIDGSRVNLNVKISRSSLTGAPVGASSSFSQSLATNRTTVQASVTARYGETIVVSGLSENEDTFNRNGVPGLREVPLLQWLFDRQASVRTRTSIVVTITPRRADEVASVNARLDGLVSDPAVRLRLKGLLDAIASRPAMVVALERAAAREFFEMTQAGDLRRDAWGRGVDGAALRSTQ